MATIRTNAHSFNGGEVTPEFFGQITDAKFQSGLALCRNFVIKPQGPAENRAGFAYVRAVKDSTKKTRLVPFTYSTTQTMIIELGAGYFRFHTQGATLLSAGVPYEVANPYAEADLFDIHYVQSADVLTLVHPNYAPRELRRTSAIVWTLTTIAFTPSIAAPTAVTATPDAVRTGYDYSYVVTAIGADAIAESVASTAGTCTNNIFVSGAKNTIAWTASAGAIKYYVYKQVGGVYGYIGQTTGVSLVDDNIAADMSRTPPLYDTGLQAAGDYPGAVSYFEQRRCFAGSTDEPQNVWMTKSGTESNMSYSLPTRDDDRVAFKISAREANTIRHIVPLTNLILLTSSAEWRVSPTAGDVITPAVSVRPQSYVGSSNVQPAIVNNNLIYCAARGGHVRELAYSWQANGFATGDLSLRAPHLFDGLNLVDMAYAKAPIPIIWAVSDNGKLLGLTYVPEQEVGAWHQHDTDGLFESCAIVAEGNEDVLYVIVRRTINGSSVRYVERQSTRAFADLEDAFFVDAGATYSGAAASTISGLTFLEGETVSILADGCVHPQRVVTGGAITLDQAASIVHVGLPIEADIQTLPLVAMLKGDGGFGQGRQKNINKVWLRVYRSSGIFAGPSSDRLVEAKQRTTEPYGSPPSLKSEEIEIVLKSEWGDSAQLFVRQSDPLPLTVVALTMEVSIAG